MSLRSSTRGDGSADLVSSGSIALGRGILGLAPGPLKLEESQAAAAAGQITLAKAYADALGRHGKRKAGQILLTLGDTEERRRYLNARATIGTLLKLGAVPIINENDSVATSEIRYGDNDRLAARVATMASADCLVLLSDIDGLYTAPPAFGSGCGVLARSPADYTGDRGNGRQRRIRTFPRRHEDQDRCREDRHSGGHDDGDHLGQGTQPAEDGWTRAHGHLVPGERHTGKRPQGLDRRDVGAARRDPFWTRAPSGR
jgi:hypothetical protein